MKYILLITTVFFISACGEKTYTETEIENYKKSVDCTGYPNDKNFDDIEEDALKKASIQKCERELLYRTDLIKPTKNKVY